MAHARNIKPGLYKNEDLAECSIWARHLFALLPMVADREGRLEDRPKRLKGELFAYDNVDVDPLLDELQAYGFIDRYSVNGRRYIQIVKFLEHQRPHGTEKDSVIPDRDGFITVHERGKNGCASGSFSKTKQDHGDLTVNQTLDHALIHRFTDSLIHKPGGEQQRGASTVGASESQGLSGDDPGLDPEPAAAHDTETPPPWENPRAPEALADAVTVRAVAVAVLLRQNGAGVAAGDPRLRQWAMDGRSDAELLTALETAERRRAESGSLQPVNAGLLDAILAGGPPRAVPSPRRDQQRTSWTQQANPRIATRQGEHHEHTADRSANVVTLDAVASRVG